MNVFSPPNTGVQYDCVPAIANKILDLFAFAISTRARSLFIRFDLMFPDNGFPYDEPEIFKSFMHLYIKDRIRHGFGDLYYVAVREKVTADHGHYHVFILLNGNATRNLYGHMEKAKEIWAKRFPGYPPNSGLLNYRSHNANNGLMLRRHDPDFDATLQECLNQAFYLAKVYSKDRFNKHGRSWSSTINIPKRRYDAFPPGVDTTFNS